MSGRTVAALKVCFAIVAVLTLAPYSSAAAQGGGSVRVVHGLRGVVADVYLDDALVLQTFQPERSTEALVVPEGAHKVEVRLAGQPPSSTPMLGGNFTIANGEQKSVVLHLANDGQPALTIYNDDESAVTAGQTRVVVRHVAAASAIDVRLGAAAVAVGLSNPAQSSNQVAAGTYQVSVTQTGTPQILAPAQDVPLAEGTENVMYFIGDQNAGTLGWIAVQTAGLQTPPAAVQTGDSGLAGHSASGPSLRDEFVIGAGALVLAAVLRHRRLPVRSCRVQ